MAKPYEISLVSNTRQLNADLSRSADSVDEISDALDDMARDGDQAGEKLERSFKDAARAAQRAGDDSSRSMTGVKDRVGETGDEVRQNLGEAIANVARGDFGALADVAGDTLGGITAGIGGIGAAAVGAAGAAGLGLIIAAFQASQEEAEKLKEQAAQWAEAYIEAGGRVLSATQLFEKAREIITDPEQYKTARQNARDWGVEEEVALLAMAGDTYALAEAREALTAKEERLAELVAQGGTARGDLVEETNELAAATENGAKSLDLLNQGQTMGIQQADLYSQALRLAAERTEGATTKVDEFGDKIVTLPDGKQIYIDAETGQATDDTEAIEQKIYGIKDKTVRVDVNVNDGALSRIESRVRALDGRSIAIRLEGQTGAGRFIL